jgi:HEAT repeat protein
MVVRNLLIVAAAAPAPKGNKGKGEAPSKSWVDSHATYRGQGVAYWRQHLGAWDPSSGYEAPADAFADLDRTAIPVLVALTLDATWRVREKAIKFLGRYDSPPEAVIRALCAALDDGDAAVRALAVRVLGRVALSSQDARSVLAQAVDHHHDGGVRSFAAQALKEAR